MKKCSKAIGMAGLLLTLCLLLAGCGEYEEEVKLINAGMSALSDVQNGHLVMTAETQMEQGLISGYDAAYTYDYHYRIDVRTFNYRVEKTDSHSGLLLEAPYKVIGTQKFDLATGEEDTEYTGKIGDFPDLLSFYFSSKLKNSYVASVEQLPADPEHSQWQGWRVIKNDSYINRVNSSRSKNDVEGKMLANYVDYWLDEAGVLVRMTYYSQDEVTQDEVTDTLEQTYTFELLAYNDPAIADF